MSDAPAHGNPGPRPLRTGVPALGGAPVRPSAPSASPAAPTTPARGGPARTLRRGSAARAGLLREHLDRAAADAAAFLGPSPVHPYYPGAVVLAARGGTVALHEAVGTAVRYSRYDEATDTGVEFPAEQQIPMTTDTVFDLASLSKLFTSLLAMRQLERGTLDLDATVAGRLPGFGAAGKQDITVRHLLTHTSGLRPDLPFFDSPDRASRLRLLWAEAPLHAPGSGYLYSDLNMIALQLVLERGSGRTLDALLHDDITGPLGMTSTRYRPPASWKPRIAATEDQRRPWARMDRGLVWGEVHDENAYAFGGVAGHAGVFSTAWDLAVLCRTLLNHGAYGTVRILRPETVDLMFSNANTAFPGHDHGLGFELYQHWYMGAMATPRTAGHTGFTGTSLVIDPTTDSFLILLSNAVHPCRDWREGSAPRVATATNLARAVPVRPVGGPAAWFSGMTSATTATLTLPELPLTADAPRLCCVLWWDTGPACDILRLEASDDAGATWRPVPFTTALPGEPPRTHRTGTLDGYSGRVWYLAEADLSAWYGAPVVLRWRYDTGPLYVGRGVYADALRVEDRHRRIFDDARPADAARVSLTGWTRSAD